MAYGSTWRSGPVDMRVGAERLGVLVRERMRAEPRSWALFGFVGRLGHRMKGWAGKRRHRRATKWTRSRKEVRRRAYSLVDWPRPHRTIRIRPSRGAHGRRLVLSRTSRRRSIAM